MSIPDDRRVPGSERAYEAADDRLMADIVADFRRGPASLPLRRASASFPRSSRADPAPRSGRRSDRLPGNNDPWPDVRDALNAFLFGWSRYFSYGREPSGGRNGMASGHPWPAGDAPGTLQRREAVAASKGKMLETPTSARRLRASRILPSFGLGR
jgi:hypothetical protein